MRAIWTGAITFGLVNVPVKLFSATEDHDVELHQVHARDGGRIRYQRRCEVCGEAVEYADIDRAYVEDDETVVLTKEELEAIPQERNREISVVEFVPTDQLDPIMFEKSYFLRPAGKSAKAYVLLRRTLEQTDRTAIVQFALRQKTRIAALRVRDDVLVVQNLLWPDEVREAEFPELDERVRITAKELQLSAALVKSFSGDFDATDFHDEYQEELRQLVRAKLAAGDALDTEATFGDAEEEDGSDAEVIDLMAALKESVQRSRAAKKAGGRRGAGGASSAKGAARSGSAGKRTAAKKSSAKKPAAKKASAKKPAAKKAEPKKPAAKRASAKRSTAKSDRRAS
ncbi:Ku protein [Leucobacter chromiiresistens]|uniref:Non-homologous end joining protein Ku n=2 Tax=Leucobacter chromiiresistens TaxID=1079994 RepID=A0A1H1A2M5_9MICO|nr:Ku protein [Leucobacter chromiiresistens]SDQ33933.1 DNA end-binding protein Ku [Leucobacter chromiiresistens]